MDGKPLTFNIAVVASWCIGVLGVLAALMALAPRGWPRFLLILLAILWGVSAPLAARSTGKRRAVLSTVAVVSLIASIGAVALDRDTGPPFTFRGAKVLNARADLKEANVIWREHVTGALTDSAGAVTTPDWAGCYFQVTGLEIDGNYYCGPVKLLDRFDTPSWERFSILAQPEKNGVRLKLDPSSWSSLEGSVPYGLMDASGVGPDMNVSFSAPDPPRVKPPYGIPLENVVGFVESHEPFTIWFPGDIWKISFGPPAQVAGRGEEQRAAPEGGTFVQVRLERQKAEVRNEAEAWWDPGPQIIVPATKVTLLAGGDEIDLNWIPSGEAATYAFAVHGDGADARIRVEAGGAAREVNAQGQADVTAISAAMDDQMQRNAKCEVTPREFDGDPNHRPDCQASISKQVWYPDLGYPADGVVYLIAYFEYKIDRLIDRDDNSQIEQKWNVQADGQSSVVNLCRTAGSRSLCHFVFPVKVGTLPKRIVASAPASIIPTTDKLEPQHAEMEVQVTILPATQ